MDFLKSRWVEILSGVVVLAVAVGLFAWLKMDSPANANVAGFNSAESQLETAVAEAKVVQMEELRFSLPTSDGKTIDPLTLSAFYQPVEGLSQSGSTSDPAQSADAKPLPAQSGQTEAVLFVELDPGLIDSTAKASAALNEALGQSETLLAASKDLGTQTKGDAKKLRESAEALRKATSSAKEAGAAFTSAVDSAFLDAYVAQASTLSESIIVAKKLLADSVDKVAVPATRDSLASAIKSAEGILAAPPADDSSFESFHSAILALQESGTALDKAQVAVSDSVKAKAAAEPIAEPNTPEEEWVPADDSEYTGGDGTTTGGNGTGNGEGGNTTDGTGTGNGGTGNGGNGNGGNGNGGNGNGGTGNNDDGNNDGGGTGNNDDGNNDGGGTGNNDDGNNDGGGTGSGESSGTTDTGRE